MSVLHTMAFWLLILITNQITQSPNHKSLNVEWLDRRERGRAAQWSSRRFRKSPAR